MVDSPWNGQAFLFIWIGFLLVMTGGIGAFFLWGVRSGQFANQDRARYLALQARIPEPGESEPAGTAAPSHRSTDADEGKTADERRPHRGGASGGGEP